MAALTWVLFCALLSAGPLAAGAADFPRAQLDEAERYYTEAYLRFLDRDYWGASDYLDRALRANTYLVDYYLLKGLAMNRIGDYGAGREALSYYMEVRPMDSAAHRIFSSAIAQQRDMRLITGTFSLAARWRFSRLDPQTEFGQGFFRPYSVKGLGKADAAGSVFCLSDTLGDSVYVCPAGGRVRTLRVESPAVTMPMGDGSFYVLTVSGDVYSFTTFAREPSSADIRGSLDAVVADGTPLSAGEFAVADPIAREIAFYSFQTLARTGSWAPSEDTGGPMLFEPVAVAAFGPWLAVADRGNDRVLFLNVRGRDFFSVSVPRPRDVLWSSIGELFVIGEDGVLSRTLVDFRARSAEVPDVMERDVRDGWALFSSPEGGVYCLDVGASRLWKGEPIPDVSTSSAFLSVFRPRIDLAENRESFVLDATLTSPFTSYAKSANLVVYSVWNDRTIPSFASWLGGGEAEAVPLFFHRPAPLGVISPALENRVVENGTDIQIALPSIWSARKDALTNILVDSSILFSQDELDALALFCLNNGVEMDIWARTVPAVELLRAGAFTGGRVVWSAANPPNLKTPRNKVQIRVPLPQELSSSGYPSRSMLTVYLDFGLIQTRDWIPLWPDLIE
ncbi:MAG: hypothetical protein LBL51_02435 [Synergistaceae bacterium]|jgi:hypothetical protein|nr:hypothetical protein [Synergistaceae bacterium]